MTLLWVYPPAATNNDKLADKSHHTEHRASPNSHQTCVIAGIPSAWGPSLWRQKDTGRRKGRGRNCDAGKTQFICIFYHPNNINVLVNWRLIKWDNSKLRYSHFSSLKEQFATAAVRHNLCIELAANFSKKLKGQLIYIINVSFSSPAPIMSWLCLEADKSASTPLFLIPS